MDGQTFRSCGADGLSWRWAPRTDEPTPSPLMRSQGGSEKTMTMTMTRIVQQNVIHWGLFRFRAPDHEHIVVRTRQLPVITEPECPASPLSAGICGMSRVCSIHLLGPATPRGLFLFRRAH